MGHLRIGWQNMAPISSEFLERLEKIRVGFLFDHPFLSVLALSIGIEFRKNSHEAFETNGMAIYVDATLAQSLDAPRLKYTYAHILMHIILKHAFRMQGRDHGMWNRSSDIVVNLLLSDFERVGIAPDDEVLLEKFRNKSVEEVYNILYEESENGEGTPEEQNPQEEKLDLIENEGDSAFSIEDLDATIVQAMGVAKKQGNIPSSFLEAISEVTKPKIDLQTLLQNYFQESFFYKQSDFSRPNRRFIHKKLYLPGYKYQKNRVTLYIALDRSMSISKETFSHFLGVIDEIVRMSIDAKVIVVPFDESVDEANIVTFENEVMACKLTFAKGNGGTLFAPLAEYINKVAPSDAFLMLLSDGFFTMEKKLDIQTIFLLTHKANLQRFQGYADTFYLEI